MGKNGQNTIDRLKAATGIADDRLSAHHPNGAGNEASMGDFLVFRVGRQVGRSYYSTQSVTETSDIPGWDLNLSIPTGNSVTGVSALPSNFSQGGALDSNGDYKLNSSSKTFEQGDKVWVRVDLSCNQYARQQIAVDQLTVTGISGAKVLQRASGTINGKNVVDFQLEITDFDTAIIKLEYNDGGYNDDAANYNRELQFFTPDVETSTPYLESLTLAYDDTGASGNQTACDGSTPLDDLPVGIGSGTAGDGNFGLRVNPFVSDPKDKKNFYLWVYTDSNNSPPDTPRNLYIQSGKPADGDPIKLTSSGSGTKTACTQFINGGTLDNGNDIPVYVYLTEDQAGNTTFTSATINYPSNFNTHGSKTKTFPEP
jgi:hypothetical protein